MFVKGSTIRSKLEFVETQWGSDERASIEFGLKDDGVSLPILDIGWYPYEAYIKVLVDLTNKFLGGDLNRLDMLGAISADKALGTIYKPFVRESGFEEFVLDLPRLHSLFYSAGHPVVNFNGEAKTCEISHNQEGAIAEADVQLAKGFYTRAAEIHGLLNVTSQIKRDPAHVVVTLKWL